MHRKILLLSALALGTVAYAADTVPLKVEYPKPLFAGTPRPIQLSNLEPANAKRTELMVPAGTKLLSKGKTVTSSDNLPVIGELSYITDGDRDGPGWSETMRSHRGFKTRHPTGL